MHKYRRWLKRLAITFAIAVLIAVAVCWYVAGQLLLPAPRTVGPPPDDFAAEDVSFASQSGSQIAAWHRRGEPGRGVVVLVHGIRSSRLGSLHRARLIAEAGFSTLLIDLQGHGESPGKQITLGHLERHDVRAAVAYARQQHPEEPVGVVGFSLGGAATALASPLDVDAVVLEAVYPTIEQAVDNRTRRKLGACGTLASWALLVQLKPRAGISTLDLQPIKSLSQFDCPILIVGGGADDLTTPADTQQMFDAAPEPKGLCWFDDLGHHNYAARQPGRYREHVVEFLKRHLSGTGHQ